MNYTFKAEDLEIHAAFECLGIFPNLRDFLKNHEERIRKSYEQLLEELRRKKKTERQNIIILQMNSAEFIELVKFTFELIFAKEFLNSSTTHNNLYVLLLAAQWLSFNMSFDYQNPEYIQQLHKVIKLCGDSIRNEFFKDVS